jgi:phage I-like protein
VPDVAFVVDAPLELAAGARSRVQVAELGSYWHGRYGDFKITATQVASWQANLTQHFQGELPIDLDHATDKGGSTEAQGWIKGLSLQDGKVYADVEWTSLGESAIREKRYRYISPTFGPLKDEHGKGLGDALMRVALTNNPHFRSNMPAVTLSADTGFADRVGGPPDSRPAMSDLLKTLAKLHGLPEDADEAKVLEAVTAAKQKAEQPPPPKTDTVTLEAAAAKEGKVLLSAEQVATLTADAAKGVKAETDLAAMTFDTAYSAALLKGRLDAKPETRQLHESIYAVDREKSLTLLASLPEGVANLTAKGEGGDHGETPDGVDPDSFQLDRKVKARMADKHETYPIALDAVLALDEAGVS